MSKTKYDRNVAMMFINRIDNGYVADVADVADVAKVADKREAVDQPKQPVTRPAPPPRTTPKPQAHPISAGPISMLNITNISAAMPPTPPTVNLTSQTHYLNNREKFINNMTSFLAPYKKEIAEETNTLSCTKNADDSVGFSLLTHQAVVRDYINLQTPYRGVLLYHGLGSGKTCSSIAIAEGMKHEKKVIIMTPASLQTNYREELKHCGNAIYNKNQFWSFVKVANGTSQGVAMANELERLLGVKSEDVLKRNGAWMVDARKKTGNYKSLSDGERKLIDLQIDEMIKSKYKFVNYNGLRNSHLIEMTHGGTKNPFDDAVVVIDEVHNFVSRIVGKLGKKAIPSPPPGKIIDPTMPVSLAMYEMLQTAVNVKIVVLTGTPMINYPNELGVLFNILRGKIETVIMKLNTEGMSTRMDKDAVVALLNDNDNLDYVDYKPTSSTLTITRNPFGYKNRTTVSRYSGVTKQTGKPKTRKATKMTKKGQMGGARTANTARRAIPTPTATVYQETVMEFAESIRQDLIHGGVDIVPGSMEVKHFQALPDRLEEFQTLFIDGNTNNIKNANLLKRRILGLTSYFRSSQEGLMPEYSRDLNFHIVKTEMSDEQFTAYESARVSERKLDANNAKKKVKAANAGKTGNDLYSDTASTYRIFSRAFCNFVFPADIERPMVNPSSPDEADEGDVPPSEPIGEEDEDTEMTGGAYEDDLDEEVVNADDADDDPIANSVDEVDGVSYKLRIKKAMDELKSRGSEFLVPEGLKQLSPKFLAMLENIQDPDHKGKHLVYSQFRTIEGIGVFKMILEQNGYTELKVKRDSAGTGWTLDIEKDKPMYALFTGMETVEHKEIVRKIFNGDWDNFNPKFIDELKAISPNNDYGELCKIFMISSSGAEGISLTNTRYVHICEPYWHPVRIHQVIGRARRICSHSALPKEYQTVEVFMYITTLNPRHLDGDGSIELRLKDKSKLDNITPVSTDESLWEISEIKEGVSNQLMKCLKESAFDCSVYSTANAKEGVKCYSFGTPKASAMAFGPDYRNDDTDVISNINIRKTTIKATKVTIHGTVYAHNKQTGEIYDLDSYQAGSPNLVGRLYIENGSYRFVRE
jgi:hypothetical protein